MKLNALKNDVTIRTSGRKEKHTILRVEKNNIVKCVEFIEKCSKSDRGFKYPNWSSIVKCKLSTYMKSVAQMNFAMNTYQKIPLNFAFA